MVTYTKYAMGDKSAIMYLTITLANRSHCYFSHPRRKFSINMQSYKFVRVAVMICATLVT